MIVNTISFIDEDSASEAVIWIELYGHKLSISLSIEEGGDAKALVSKETAREIVNALEESIGKMP